MIDGKRVNIKLIDGSSQSWLCLQGTILSLYANKYGSKTHAELPLEQLNVIQENQGNSNLLFYALFVPVLFFLSSFFLSVFIDLIIGNELNQSISFYYWVVILSICTVIFLYFIIHIFLRTDCITVISKYKKESFTFWMCKNDLQALVQEIQYRKTVIEKINPYPLNYVLSETDEKYVRKSLPYLFFGIILGGWLTIALCLLALFYLPFHILYYLLKNPFKYWIACHHFGKKNYKISLKYVNDLIEKKPENIPAKLLQIRLLTRLNQFYQAERGLVEIRFDISPEEYESMLIEIRVWERIWKRKKAIKPLNLPDFNFNPYQAEGLRLRYISWN